MPMSASHWIKWVALWSAVATVGCSSTVFQRPKSVAAKDDETASDLAKALEEATAELPPEPAPTTKPAATGLDPETFQELMAELQQLNETDPEAAAELAALVKDGDPALVPSMLETWKKVLKQKRQSSTTLAAKPEDAAALQNPDLALTGIDDALNEPSDTPSIQRTSFQEESAPPSESHSNTSVVTPVDDFDSPQALVEPGTSSELGMPSEPGMPSNAGTPSHAGTPATADPTGDGWETYLDQLIAQTEAELAASPSPGSEAHIQKQVYLRMLYLMAGMDEQALAPIEGVDDSQEEFWKNTLWAMSNYFDRQSIPQGADRATETVKRLTMAANRLRREASLEVTNLAFCRRINSFGNYDVFPGHPNYEFKPGSPVLLYCEVENFESQLEQSQYRTVLQSTVEITDSQGKTVWQQQFEPTVDVCQNRRSDFFLTFGGSGKLRIPQSNPGEYVLKLTVQDQLAGKIGQGTIKFRIK
jgi:hypothetical protein